MNKKALTTGGVLIAVLLLLAVNLFSNTLFTASRFDLTANNLYTFSDGTKKILSELDEPIFLRLFLSQKMVSKLPGIVGYTQRVKELLDEYARISNGKVTVKVIDPEPFTNEEDLAEGYGLQGIPIEEGGSTFYFGLVGSGSVDDERTIPFFTVDREAFVEYDITKLIYQLANPKKTVIGLMTSVPMDGSTVRPMPGAAGPQPWTVYSQMEQFFEIKTLSVGEKKIPEQVDVLMLVHPKGLEDETLYAIDQYILGGGRALVFADPYAEADQAVAGAMGLPPGRPGRSEIDHLLKAWGLELEKDKVVGDLSIAVKVRGGPQQGGAVFDYPIWMQVQPNQLNKNDVVTSKLANLTMASVGILKPVEDSKVEVTPLIHSGPTATTIDTSSLGLEIDPEQLLRDYRPGTEKLLMGARVTGKISSAYPDGPPAKKDSDASGENKQDAKIEHLAESKGDINLIVIADMDMLHDRFWVRVQEFLGQRIVIPEAANGSLVINALDNLTGSNDLIGVRNRGTFSRPFTVVQQIREQAEFQYRQKERELLAKLNQTEQKLKALEGVKKGEDNMIISQAQQDELVRFRDERLLVRKDLRDVRLALRKDIETLGSWMKFINIGLMPLLIGIGGIIIGVMLLRRRQRRTQPAVVTES